LTAKKHNPNGPAYQSWYENGQMKYETYWVDGKRHNPNGPAYQSWYNNSEIDCKEYYIDSKQISEELFKCKYKSCNCES